jgi:hypothetical protein
MNTLKNNSAILLLLLVLFLHTLVLTKVTFLPYPEIFIYPYLTNHGLVPYKDIFDQHFPGLMFLPINFNNLGMVTPEAARSWMIAITLITQILIFLIGRKIFKSNYLALVANFFYLLWHPLLEGWIPWLEIYQALFFLPAFYFSYVFLERKEKNYQHLLAIGILLSFALLFKQVTLPLAFILLVYLFWKTKKVKTIYMFLVGFLPVPILTAFYFWTRGALLDMWFWTIWFNLTTFAKFGRKAGDLAHWVRIGVVFGPILGLPFVKNKNLAILLAIFTVGNLSEAVSRFDFVHFQGSLPFACFIIVLVIAKFWNKSWFKLFLTGYLVINLFWVAKFYQGYLSGKVFFWDQETLKVAEKIKQYTHREEQIFLLGPVPHLYFLSDTLPSGNIFVFQFPWFLMESEDKFLNALKTDPPNLIVRDRTVNIEGWTITDYAHNLDQYISSNYVTFDRVGNNEFMKRKSETRNSKSETNSNTLNLKF